MTTTERKQWAEILKTVERNDNDGADVYEAEEFSKHMESKYKQPFQILLKLPPTMPPVYHLDFETFSECDLRTRGAYKYASHPSTEILMLAIAEVDGPIYRWYNPKYNSPELVTDPGAWELLDKLGEDPESIVYAHNAQFEMAVTRYRWDKDIGTRAPVPRQWRCTATMARVAALPASLEKCAEALNLAAQKDKEGSRLIKKFSVPQKVHKSKQMVMGTSYRINPLDEPKEFKRFADYCVQDVRVEKEIHQRLKSFELTGALEQAFMFDSEMNDRGIPVNLSALKTARRIVRECMADLNAEFKSIVGCNQTQGKVFKAWLDTKGYPGKDLKALTVEESMATAWIWADLDAIRALELHACLAFAAVKKLDSMVNCECGDGYVRGTMRFYGAGTGRWSASLIQPQNFKRPSPHLAKVTGDAYAMICAGCSREELQLMYGDPIEVIASCIRHFIQRPGGKMFLNADYAAVEARIVCWLAGQEDALVRFRRYDAADTPEAKKLLDPYVHMGSVIYNTRCERVTKDERWVGKQSVLGCGFSMWVDAFQAQCSKYGVELPYETCEKAVLEYRRVYDKVEQLWADFEQAARLAINNHGKWFEAGPKVKFGVTKRAGILYLVMRLPSSREIVYPHVKIEWCKRTSKAGRERTVEQITFWGQVKDNFWGRCSTYGAKLVENATQGTAFDLMAHGSVTASDLGFEIPTLIHDEALGNEEPGKSIEDFSAALCNTPAWAAGLPIVAEGGVVPYYTKD